MDNLFKVDQQKRYTSYKSKYAKKNDSTPAYSAPRASISATKAGVSKHKAGVKSRLLYRSTVAIGVSSTVLGCYFLNENGYFGEHGINGYISKLGRLSDVREQWFEMLNKMDYYRRITIQEPQRDKMLPDPLPFPYVQPSYTLVLELTGVLVQQDHEYEDGTRFKKRPGIREFLEAVTQTQFEVVVYTREQGKTAFPILNSLDPKGYIAYRLVRDSTNFINGSYLKNIHHLNRDMKKVILVDWNENAVLENSRNMLVIPKWTGDEDDQTLADLTSFLKAMAKENVEDVREVLDYYKQFDHPLEAYKDRQRSLMEQNRERKEEKEQEIIKPSDYLPYRWFSKLFNR